MQRPKILEPNAVVRIEHMRDDPKNTNVMAPERYEQLKSDIEALGFFQPVLLQLVSKGSKNKPPVYLIIDGHHRRRAAAELGYEELPAVILDATEAARVVLNIAMNRLRGEPDLAKVGDALRGLETLGVSPADMRLTGFSDEELEVLLRAGDEDDIGELGSAPEEEGDGPAEVQFVLEIAFDERAAYQRAKKALKKMAPDGDLARALLALLD